MMQFTMYFMALISSIIFMQMNHPLAMGLMLLVQTMLICLITGLISQSFWFSYILFLIFIGGMLVLFIYVTSLASNEMFSMSSSITMMSIMMIASMTMMLLIIDKTMIHQFFENMEMLKMDSFNMLNKENSMNLMKLYNLPTNLLTAMLINYLLITLVATVKITNMFMGPLRQQN